MLPPVSQQFNRPPIADQYKRRRQRFYSSVKRDGGADGGEASSDDEQNDDDDEELTESSDLFSDLEDLYSSSPLEAKTNALGAVGAGGGGTQMVRASNVVSCLSLGGQDSVTYEGRSNQAGLNSNNNKVPAPQPSNESNVNARDSASRNIADKSSRSVAQENDTTDHHSTTFSSSDSSDTDDGAIHEEDQSKQDSSTDPTSSIPLRTLR